MVFGDSLFFRGGTAVHWIILHLANSELEFYGVIKKIERAHPSFYRCHKSYLINPAQVKQIGSAKRLVEMSNHELCLVSVRALPGLLKLTK